MIDPVTVWTVTVLLGIGTFLLRLSFLGVLGRRELPEWLLRHLRYVAVAVLPGLVAPLVVWPQATGGALDAPRLAAAAAALLVGAFSRNFFGAVAAGAAALYGLPFLLAT
ncbi:AzlD domain-containing protein [Paroceanicella profunda]|uniref:AzlD domain-containing protein n=1 Tax=Paroceanicella profunda TaxID=2579971 RepID=A0A5B8FHG6_9RHOB|nr:AzlD domain-containing protein [Paroceanicella profunda]QDL92391.1 AzlD domain-containing protein [Paroceanicella profunda]